LRLKAEKKDKLLLCLPTSGLERAPISFIYFWRT